MRRLLWFSLLVGLLLVVMPAAAQTTSTAAQVPAAAEISVGDEVEGTLTEAAPSAEYALQGAGGMLINISLISEDFDSYLSVKDDEGNIVAFNDDSNGERNSRIVGLSVPEGVVYTIVAESYGQYIGSAAQTGDYTLSVSEAQVLRIEYTQTTEGELTSDALSLDYIFTGSSGDTVVINQHSDDFDSYLRLLDASGAELSSNDDSGGSLDSQIGPFPLPSTGSYTIRASSLSGEATGDFTLSLNRIESQAIAYGDSVEVEFTDKAREQYFTFSGAYGDIVTITADSNRAVDTNLTLNDPYNSQVMFDEDGGSGSDPEIDGASLFADGTFTIILRAVDSANGTVVVTLDRVPPQSLDEGSQIASFSSSRTQIPMSFTGVAGETVRLTLSSPDGAVSSSLNLDVRQDGTSIAYANANTLSAITVEFTVPNDGDVNLVISEYSYTNFEFEVTLERVG
ncbi:MAG: PPC domain-containing protein [Anaerolineae bacterium]|nr:PPC domain-containing protein [Anaerolineae bacterium]